MTHDQPYEAQPSAPEQPQYQEVSEEELKRIFTDHQEWLETKGDDGIQANLSLADLQGADLISAKLQGANLSLANLQEADLAGAKLQGANLRVANLQKADLSGANLQGADLSGANLQGANLNKAYLKKANLGDANLSGANLTEAKKLTQKQLDQACGDEKTKLPEGLTIATCREEQEGSTDGDDGAQRAAAG